MAFGVQIHFDPATAIQVRSIVASLTSIASSLASEQEVTKSIEASLSAIAKAIETPPIPPAVSISLALPSITKKGVLMPNFELANDEVATIPILVDSAAGTPVPAPAGDTFTVVSSNPASLGAAISGTSVVLTPLVQASPGLSITVSDSAGLSAFTQLVDIVVDATPKAITLDVVHATEVSQPVPTATGP